MAEPRVQSKWLEGKWHGEAERQGRCLFGQGHDRKKTFFFPDQSDAFTANFVSRFFQVVKTEAVRQTSGSLWVNST